MNVEINPSEYKVLIVDDVISNVLLLKVLLTNEKFNIVTAGNGTQALEQVKKEKPDLVLLDVMMPGLNGYQTCMEIRKKSNVPILFLSARTQVEDKIMGFSSGGDDYLPKPFSYQELISRVKALVRRYHVYQGSGRRTQEEKMCSGALEVYPEAGTVWKNGKEISLTDTEFSILCTLMKHRKQIFSVEHLYEAVWEETYYYGAANIVMVHIRNLRSKIEDDPGKPRIIRTIWGRGYRCD